MNPQQQLSPLADLIPSPLPYAPPLRRVPRLSDRSLQWSCPPRAPRLEQLAPAPGTVPEPGASRPAPPVPWVLALVLLCAGPLACARMDAAPLGDAGAFPSVAQVLPAPGAVTAPAAFQISFSTPRDPSLLLSDVDQSETLGLVPLAQAEVMAAALGHSRLTAREKSLLVPAQVSLDDHAATLTLAPLAPLAAGDYALLFSPRLRSADGRKLSGTLRYPYQVRALPPQPALLSPLAGSAAPRNLRRVRLDLPEARPSAVLALVDSAGLLLGAIASPAEGGEATLDLCPGGRCAALAAGNTLSLTLGGEAIPGATFTVAACTRDLAPALLASDLRSTATGLAASVSLDWPAQVTAEWAAAPVVDSQTEESTDDETLARLCDQGACSSAAAFALGAPDGCAPLLPDAAANAQVALDGLASGTAYLVRLVLEDDEGHRAVLPARRADTQNTRPAVSIEEVMASPPLPQPRNDGEYVELFNPGPGPVDTARLALQGADGVVRPFQGTSPAPVLAAGARALAVGLSFDASRYPLPPGLVILRAKAQRLLARGLNDDGTQPFALVWLPQSAATLAPLELSRFPGDVLHCSEGRSLERVRPAPKPGEPLFACGAIGGSPGKAP
jgi:hypothetical protein